jgi:DNA mismatch endonuclease (patch repair protein)
MSDVFTKEKRSAIMAAIRSKGNKGTEGILIGILGAYHVKGWRRHLAIEGKPDFAFQRERVAVFVDGCFWHGCAAHCRMPANNCGCRKRKVARN